MSPGLSFGVKENGVRQFGQKPSGRPGRPSRERPTGLPHLAQNRRSSGTWGATRMALLGSIGGAPRVPVVSAARRAPPRGGGGGPPLRGGPGRAPRTPPPRG